MSKITYVLAKDGNPLMPTENCAKVRRLLKENKAKVVKRTPFTIQLTYNSPSYTQPVSLGVKPGYERMLISASSESKELFSERVELRTDIPKKLETRRNARRTRRNRLRYRPARWQNRVSSKKEGWLAPSVTQKIDAHIKEVEKVAAIIPVKDVYIEVAKYDVQRIINPDIEGTEYQEGLNGYNVREYVLERDKFKCRCCKGKSKDPVLGVHHLKNYLAEAKTPESYKKHYSPSNTITICMTCHGQINAGELTCNIKTGGNFKGEAFSNISRWRITKGLKESFGDENVHVTFGYLTKAKRISRELPSNPSTYALCITENINALPSENFYLVKRRRIHNRQIYRAKASKGGVYKKVQSPIYMNGIRLWDKVIFEGKECFVTGRNRRGYVALKTLTGEAVHSCAKIENVRVVESGIHPISYEKVESQVV